jgi:hypothetical protein
MYEGLLISPQPYLLSDVGERNRYRRWKKGPVDVPNCKSFLVTEVEMKHVRDTFDLNNIETPAVINFFRAR